MERIEILFNQEKTNFIFNATQKDFRNLVERQTVVLLMDENVKKVGPGYFDSFPVITVPAGEASKSLNTSAFIIEQLIALNIDRNALLVGIGGGVVCDLAGFVAGIYKRGIRCAFVPTSVLAMVDAAVGGKNGLNFGSYKNMIGLIRQPKFIFYDYSLLNTLPETEWQNGFSEIIKHACIADKEMFEMLSCNTLQKIKEDETVLSELIKSNVLLKAQFVKEDEFEEGNRRKLNFGHTLGHAVERELNLKHGFAVAAGMSFAAEVSGREMNFRNAGKVKELLKQYGLPTKVDFDKEHVLHLMQADKKRDGQKINFVLLKDIGEAIVRPIDFEILKRYLHSLC